MIPSESRAPDQPFPGAHSQVPGARGHHPDPNAPGSDAALPLESHMVGSERGWVMRLPVRAEQIMIAKQTVVHERVIVRRRQVQDRVRMDATTRREQLQLEVEGDVTSRPLI